MSADDVTTDMGDHRLSQPAGAGRSGYVPALDGLRALAIVAVAFYHAAAPG